MNFNLLCQLLTNKNHEYGIIKIKKKKLKKRDIDGQTQKVKKKIKTD